MVFITKTCQEKANVICFSQQVFFYVLSLLSIILVCTKRPEKFLTVDCSAESRYNALKAQMRVQVLSSAIKVQNKQIICGCSLIGQSGALYLISIALGLVSDHPGLFILSDPVLLRLQAPGLPLPVRRLYCREYCGGRGLYLLLLQGWGLHPRKPPSGALCHAS